MKGIKGLTKWLSVGVLASAIAAPAGAVSAAAGSHTVQYKVYYVNQGGYIDWNSFMKYYFQGYPVYTKPVNPPAQQQHAKPVTPPPAAKPATTEASGFASQVVTMVNRERAKAGLGALVSNARLANMAMVKAQDMKNNNYFSHNSPTYGSPFDMMKRFGITYHYAGENIAMGQRDPQEVVTAWMNSPGHKANILNKNYTSIGVAYYNGEWVQEFIG